MKIYVPDLNDYKCFYVRGEGIIRAYKDLPQNNSSTTYRDYYIDSHYIFTDGIQSFSYSQSIPDCLDSSLLTDSIYYRNDFDSILIIFLILFIFIIYFPFRIFSRFFGRWLKL